MPIHILLAAILLVVPFGAGDLLVKVKVGDVAEVPTLAKET